jgi:hypothetical protein
MVAVPVTRMGRVVWLLKTRTVPPTTDARSGRDRQAQFRGHRRPAPVTGSAPMGPRQHVAAGQRHRRRGQDEQEQGRADAEDQPVERHAGSRLEAVQHPERRHR